MAEDRLTQPVLMRIPEAARALAVSPSTLWRMVQTGELTSVRLRPDTPHSAVRVRRDDVLALAAGERIEPGE
jgi:excisionase family DNA binding protein